MENEILITLERLLPNIFTLSQLEKNNLYHNIKDIIKNNSPENASMEIMMLYEGMLKSRISDALYSFEEGSFEKPSAGSGLNGKKGLFRRVT